MAGFEWCNGLFTWVRDYHLLAQASLLPRPEEQIGGWGVGEEDSMQQLNQFSEFSKEHTRLLTKFVSLFQALYSTRIYTK
jgi:hypothetical protein